jgi:hypothetical protein
MYETATDEPYTVEQFFDEDPMFEVVVAKPDDGGAPWVLVLSEVTTAGATVRVPHAETEAYEAELAAEMTEGVPTYEDLEAEIADDGFRPLGTEHVSDRDAIGRVTETKPGGPHGELLARAGEHFALRAYDGETDREDATPVTVYPLAR